MKYVRLRTITERLASGDRVSVLNLADELGVSPSTVRRDLQSLAASGILLRVHGGAAPVDGRDLGDRPFDLVADEDAIDKGRIAGRAATLVNDGDVVLLDIGTTTRLLARELFGRPITAVTSSLAVLDELRGDTTSEVVLLGGAVRRQYHSLVGSLTEDALRQVRAATVFLSASGVSSDGAVLDTTLVEMPTKRGLLRAANRVVLLAGSSKFPGSGSFRVCGMDQIDVLVTTHGADPATLKACRAQGTEVLFA